MNDMISRKAAIEAINELTYPSDLMDVKSVLANMPTVDAIPVSWIKERIENAINAKQTLIAQMWLELIVGYMNMKEKND